MSKKTTKTNTPDKKSGYVTTLRHGAVAATVWLRTGAEGFRYLTFTLSRSFQSKNGGKPGYSTYFFDYNDEALLQVIGQAACFVREFKHDPEAAIEAGRKLNHEKNRIAQSRSDSRMSEDESEQNIAA